LPDIAYDKSLARGHRRRGVANKCASVPLRVVTAKFFVIAVALWAMLNGALCTWAQEAVPQEPTTGLNISNVNDRLKRVEESPDLDKDQKAKIVDLYKGTLEQLTNAKDWEAKVVEWQTRRQTDPDDLKRFKSELDTPPADPVLEVPDNLTLPQLEQKLVDAESKLKSEQAKRAEYEAEPKRRRTDLPGLVNTAQERLKEVDRDLAALPPATESLDIAEARRAFLSAMHRAVQAELDSYDHERAWYEASTELIAVRQDVAAQRVRQAEGVAKRCRTLLNEQRKLEAMKQAEEARRAAVAAMPELKTLADRNAELTQEQNGPDGFPAKIAGLAKEVDDLKKQLADLRAKFTRVQARIDAGGMTDAVGLILQKQQADLPDLRVHRQRLQFWHDEASRAKAKLIELDDQHDELDDLDSQVNKVMGTIDPNLPVYQRYEIEAALRELLKARRGYLKSQIDACDAYLEEVDLKVAPTERNLIEEIGRYKEFISERILWVRSSPVLSSVDFRRALDGLLKIGDGPQLWAALADLAWDARDNPMIYVLAATLLIPLVGAQRYLRRKVYAVDLKTTQAYAADIKPTVHVAILTGLIAALWPLVIYFIAWRMTAPDAASLHAQNIAYGLQATALLLLTTELLRQICRRKGLAEAHFGWPSDAVAMVARHLRWAMLLGLPLTFLVTVAESPEFDVHRSPLGRIAFMAGLLSLAAFSHCVLHPGRGLLHTLTDRPDVSWFWRKPRAWYLASVTGPLVLAIVAASGYFYTALQLASRLHATLWLLLGLLIAQAFALRCLLVARRKLAIKQARERRAAALAQSQHHAHTGPTESAMMTSERTIDLVTIDLQTRRLLRSFVNVALIAGCWLIWIDVLPALGILDRCELWSYSFHKTTANGEDLVALPSIGYITLGDVLLSGVVLLLTVVASRNLPGLLEIAFLQRLPMDPGGRYAITTVSRYVITLVGLAVAFWMIGIGWSNVQWLVAAMTVGLGFGLQEIFANFVSGLIILFERPMRVGDTVTIGGISGNVSRIRIRATTITDGDRKELIVPNKEFITGQLINWTLTDTILRMVIRVGVAYGTDIALARALLLKAAQDDHRVLREPPVTAVLDQFGDSTLNFELRLFVAGLEEFAEIRHDLNTRIDKLFRESGIEMAFPQYDVHVRSIEPALGVVSRVDSPPLKRAS
jgi:potassium efflux system protein